MYYSIVPQAKLPRNIGGLFIYSSDTPLKKGDIVVIQFRKKKVLGVLVDEVKSMPQGEKIKIKPVLKFIASAPPYFVDLLLWLHSYYLNPLSFFFAIMSPRASTRAHPMREQKDVGLRYHELSAPSSLVNSIKDTIQSDAQFINTIHLTKSAQFIIYIKLIENAIKKGLSVMLLVPTIAAAYALPSYFPQSLKANLTVLTSELYKSKVLYFNVWQHIIKGTQPFVIIGTRSAIFAPLKRLGLIIIDQAESDEYKQYDQNPRYDARTVALKLGELTGCGVKMFSDGVIV